MLNFLPKTTQKQFYLIHAHGQRHRKHLAYNRLAMISSTPYIGNGTESTYAYNRQHERLQGMLLMPNEDSIMQTQKQSAIYSSFSGW